MITQERLKELFYYHPESGDFIRLTNRGGVRIGTQAGVANKDGYFRIAVDHKHYLAHRLAWLYMCGEFPPEAIDHINRESRDGRFVNFRLATKLENNRNVGLRRDNTSGYKGVDWNKRKNRWRARINSMGVSKSLGYFGSLEEAAQAYRLASKIYHGEFSPFI